MGQEVLNLSTSGGQLGRTVRNGLPSVSRSSTGWAHECRLGGGTALAARWHHRDSFDIDLTVSATATWGAFGRNCTTP